MRRRYTFCSPVLVLLGCVYLVGCAQLHDKFVRPRKRDDSRATYRQVRAYDVRPNLELYTTRYIYWRSWHSELLQVLDDSNHKKKLVAVRESLSNLNAMRRMLEDEMAEDLQGHIDILERLRRDMESARLTGANLIRTRRDLQVLGRNVSRDFSYTKVPGHLRAEFAE